VLATGALGRGRHDLRRGTVTILWTSHSFVINKEETVKLRCYESIDDGLMSSKQVGGVTFLGREHSDSKFFFRLGLQVEAIIIDFVLTMRTEQDDIFDRGASVESTSNSLHHIQRDPVRQQTRQPRAANRQFERQTIL